MVTIKKLSNNIPVVLEKMDHLRSVSLGVYVRVGSLDEREDNNGISHVVEHMLFKGTKKRSAKQLANDCALVGGNFNAYTTKEYTSYYFTTLDHHLPEAIEILSDMFHNSLFDAEDLEKEKGVIIDEINMYDDSPEDLVHELLQQEVWQDHPLGYIISGEEEVVYRLTREQIIDFFNKHYSAKHLVISVAGNYNDNIMTLLEEAFGETCVQTAPSVMNPPTYHRTFVTREKDIEQVYMNLAFDGVTYFSEDKYVLAIVNSILGGGENSRLFQIIREELGLSYSIYSYDSSFGLAGLLHIDAIASPSNVEKVLVATVNVVKELVEHGITEYELLRAKEQINTEMIIAGESSRTRVSSNGQALLLRGKITSQEEVMERINAVTLEDALVFVRKYLKPEQMSICLIGNLKELPLAKLQEYWATFSPRDI